LAERYRYTAYGKTTIKNSVGTVLSSSAIGNRYAFTGRWLNYEIGLYDYRSREYSVETGRFIQRDPLSYADGMNLYAYVHNNPTTFTDPYGLTSWWETTRRTMGMSWGERYRGMKAIHDFYADQGKNLSNTARHYQASKAACAQYGPADAAMAGVAQEYVSFWRSANKWQQGKGFDWSGYDTAADFYNDYRGIRDGMK
jgi:RHS repeat-associated protein